MSVTAFSENALKTMQLNDQKAGMQGLDKEAINKIIYEASKGTPYFFFQQKRQQRIDRQIKEMLEELQKISDAQRKESIEKMDSLCLSLESERDLSHSIVHIDMDAFYAAVEMLDNPDLKSKPMAVGSLSMLSTSNYEARKYGVRAAMPGFIAKKLCPELTIVPSNFDKYRRVSKHVMNIIKEYDSNCCAASLDEVYFDLTDYIYSVYHRRNHTRQCEVDSACSQVSYQSDDEYNSETSKYNCQNCNLGITFSTSVRDKLAYEIVEEIRKKIYEATQLTASAGIAPTTMLAKVCSDQNKPNGQYQICSDIDDVKKFIQELPVKKISGIGPVQSQMLNALGIYTCSDLYSKRDLVDLLFSPTSAHFYMRVALGIGSTVVKSDRVRKSIGVEETFRETNNPIELHKKCQELCSEVVDDLKSHHVMGKVVVLKIKTVDFDVHTRNLTLSCYTSDNEVIGIAAKKLLDGEIKAVAPAPLKLRLMGIRITHLIDESEVVDEKQAKLKDFLQPRSATHTETIQPSQGQNKFTCPVCSLEFSDCINTFSLHVDQCLMSQTPATCSDSNKLNSSSLSETYQKSLEVQQNAEDLQFRKCDEVLTKLTCPVCGMEPKSNDLADLNAHIDSCLSRITIKELLSADNHVQTAEKRHVKKCSDDQKKKKKVRSGPGPFKTIDCYFH